MSRILLWWFENGQHNALIAALKTTWLRKITTENNSLWSIILQV